MGTPEQRWIFAPVKALDYTLLFLNAQLCFDQRKQISGVFGKQQRIKQAGIKHHGITILFCHCINGRSCSLDDWPEEFLAFFIQINAYFTLVLKDKLLLGV
ncbi:MAG: hypothetical protein AAF597_11910 [Bacteroidota bacterium]